LEKAIIEFYGKVEAESGFKALHQGKKRKDMK
jgi:hypothetical protein